MISPSNGSQEADHHPKVRWIVQSFGDVSGQNQCFDERRVRIFKNNMSALFDRKEALSN
jgi:hypothetical protein